MKFSFQEKLPELRVKNPDIPVPGKIAVSPRLPLEAYLGVLCRFVLLDHQAFGSIRILVDEKKSLPGTGPTKLVDKGLTLTKK